MKKLTHRERRLLDELSTGRRMVEVLHPRCTMFVFVDEPFERDPTVPKSLLKKKLVYQREISRFRAFILITPKGEKAAGLLRHGIKP
jgi:hypothetical protein